MNTNSRLPEGQWVFHISHIEAISSTAQAFLVNKPLYEKMMGSLQKDKFTDASQGPASQTDFPKNSFQAPDANSVLQMSQSFSLCRSR